VLLPVRRYRLRLPPRLLPEPVSSTRRVLFVCVENAARSLMAEAIFNARAPEGWVAESAGTRPAAGPNPRTGECLTEIGLSLPAHPPQALQAEQLNAAAVVVTMGCLDDASCPANLRNRDLRDWGLPDPAALDDDWFRAVRNEIERRVASLVAELPPGDGETDPVRPP
jgi:arsenate reductase (thioredoxin)